MTNEEYVFKQTEKERKRLARGAYNKVSGARSRKCTMPSEYMTEAERRKMNGEVKSWNISKRMTWIEFLQMPADLQLEYENRLAREHGARMIDIADYLGTEASNLGNFNWRHKFKVEYRGNKNMSDDWKRFIALEEPMPQDISEPVEEEKAPEAQISAVKPEEILLLNKGSVSLTGKPAAIFEKMLMLLDRNEQYVMQISFTRKALTIEE